MYRLSSLILLICIASLALAGCGGGSNTNASPVTGPGQLPRSVPTSVITASENVLSGNVIFYGPAFSDGSLATAEQWSKYAASVNAGLTTAAIGLANPNGYGPPQYYLVITKILGGPAVLQGLHVQVITGLGYSDFNFDVVVTAGENPTTIVTFPMGNPLPDKDLQPTPGASPAIIQSVVANGVFDYIAKNTAALNQQQYPVTVGAAVAKTYSAVYVTS